VPGDVRAAELRDTPALLEAPALSERLCAYEGCRQPLQRRFNEGSSNWRKRKYCSGPCQASSRRHPVDTKPCETCGETIVRSHMNKVDWQKRRWCSRACRYAKNPTREASKTCLVCGVTFTRGHRSIVDFTAQKYCGAECRTAAQRGEDPPILAGPYVPYDIDEAPPCFLDAEFFREEERIVALLSRPGRKREGLLAAPMDNVRDIWCLDCPLMAQCAEWAVESGHTGIAGGDWYQDGEKQ
jgi:hypothetical protein